LTTQWSSDTCDCIIQYNGRVQWIKSVKHCRLHKNLNGQNHLDTAMAMNKRFNFALGIDYNADNQDYQDLIISKEINKRRIRTENLDNFHEHLPDHHTPTFLENLRNFLRLNP